MWSALSDKMLLVDDDDDDDDDDELWDSFVVAVACN